MHITRPLAVGSLALLIAGPTPAPATPPADAVPVARQQAQGPVTDAGFAAMAYDTTFYAEVPMVGQFGQDVMGDTVTQTLRMAAANPHVRHAVYMLDSQTAEGGMFGEEVAGIQQDALEIHGVVRNATLLSTASVFYCDSIFIVDGAHIGGLPLHRYIPPGSEEVTAKQVGIFIGQLASAAEVHGHNPDIVRAMINTEDTLHYWRENGVVYVSNTPPPDTGSVDDYQHITPLVTGETITLDYDQLIRFEVAEPIEEFAAEWVGEKIGAPHWVQANRFGIVAGDIAEITAGLAPLLERLDWLDKQLPPVERTRENRNDPIIRMQVDIKRSLERGVGLVEQINEHLETLYTTHPERHAYFYGANGQTVLEDTALWEADLAAARRLVSQTRSALGALNTTIQQLDMAKLLYNIPQANFDPAELEPFIELIDQIDTHLDGIRRHGNAHYWENVYEEPMPEDEYGVTYG